MKMLLVALLGLGIVSTPVNVGVGRAAIFSWIEIWYNCRRRHSSLRYVSPEQFELNLAA